MSLLSGDDNPGTSAGPAPAAPATPASPPKRGAAELFSGLRVSLMPSELEGREGPDLGRRLLILVLVLVVETLAVGGIWFLLTQRAGAQEQKRAELRTRIAELDKSVAAAEALAKESVNWNAQRASVKETLDGHVYWSSFFKHIESKTLPTVKYLNFSGDADGGTVTLDALGDSYRAVAQQIVIFRADPMVDDVRTTSAAAHVDQLGEVTGVSFSMILRFKPEVWRQAPSAATSSAQPAPQATTSVDPQTSSGGAGAGGQPQLVVPAEPAETSPVPEPPPVTGAEPPSPSPFP